MDGYENERLSYVLLIEQAGSIFGIRFGTFTPDENSSLIPPVCPPYVEPNKKQHDEQ